jgi:LysR family transcriptional regulator, glycine cleavage system transcriptional activator
MTPFSLCVSWESTLPPDLPPLPWLRAFEAAARHLSFTAAGAELNLTQAAVSKQVKALELRLGQALFVRRPRSLELTKTAEAFLPKVQDAFQRLDAGAREVFGRSRAEALTLRCAVSFAVNWLAPRLPAFVDRYPGKRIRVLSSVWNDAFDKDLFDLDIQYGLGHWPGFAAHRLTWETITPLCSPSYRKRLALSDVNDLERCRLLHVLGYQEGWGVWLKAAGARTVDPGQGLQFDTSVAAFAMAAVDGGVALGRRSLAVAERSAGRLIAPFDLELPVREGFHLLVPAHQHAHSDAAAFTEWLLSQADRPERSART